MTDKTATLGVEGTNHQFMLLDGTVAPEVIDIRKLYGETGMFTYDPGFTSTANGIAPTLTVLAALVVPLIIVTLALSSLTA